MAAVTLYQSNPGIIDRFGVGSDLVSKAVDSVRVRLNDVPLQGAEFFRIEQARGGTYKESSVGTVLPLPAVNEDTDDVPFVTPQKGFPKEFTLINYRNGIKIERSLIEDQIEALATRLGSGLLQSGRILLEYLYANVFNQATNSSYEGADGVCLASASHPFERPANGTWSNVESAAALTASTFFTARKNLRKRKNEYNDPMPMELETLVVTPENEGKAKEIASSELLPDSALNNKNVWMGSFNVKVYDWLTSTTAWFLKAKMDKMNSAFVQVNGQAPNIASLSFSDNPDIVGAQRLRMRVAVGFMVPKEIQYNAGA